MQIHSELELDNAPHHPLGTAIVELEQRYHDARVSECAKYMDKWNAYMADSNTSDEDWNTLKNFAAQCNHVWCELQRELKDQLFYRLNEFVPLVQYATLKIDINGRIYWAAWTSNIGGQWHVLHCDGDVIVEVAA